MSATDDDEFNVGDEEYVLANFDEEANIIVQKDTLPVKSSDRYMLVYNTYKKWKDDNFSRLSENEENNLLVYFKVLNEKVKPTTLWCVWSMLHKTLGVLENINLKSFLSLKSYLKKLNKGYIPQKAFVLRWHHISKFMNEANDFTELSKKVIIFLNFLLIENVLLLMICLFTIIFSGNASFWYMWLLKMQ